MPDPINILKSLCNDCQNCATLNTKKGKIKTEHFSGEEYSWDKFTEIICKLTATGMRNVSKCDHHKPTDPKSIN